MLSISISFSSGEVEDEYEIINSAIVDLKEKFPEQLKKSILQEAVQGKLVPQDPSDEPASILEFQYGLE